ncbi:Acyl transferase domain protein [uncultured archaeon]|nr:Acyl transferase domain protein [uncultured archaeon]
MQAKRVENLDSLGVLKVYTGQGFASPGMGMDVLAQYEEVRKLYRTAREITGIDIERLCREGSPEQQRNTRNQQAMVYLNIAALVLRTEGLLFDRNEIWRCPEFEETRDQRKTVYLGFSLGEILALLAAKRFSFVDGLKIIKTRSELMAREGKGALASVLGGKEKEVVKAIHDKMGVYWAISKSDDNTSIGGDTRELLLSFCEELRAQGKIRKIIPTDGTSAAFHTPLFEQEGYELREYLRTQSGMFRPSDGVVISNLDARPYPGSVEDTINTMSGQIHQTALFRYSVKSVEERIEEVQVIGPGAEIMAKIVKANIPGMPVTTIETAASLNSYWDGKMRRLPSLSQH